LQLKILLGGMHTVVLLGGHVVVPATNAESHFSILGVGDGPLRSLSIGI